MQNTSTAKPLVMKNLNNKFQCDAFVEIHFAPPAGKVIRDEDFEKIYVIQDGDKSIFVQLLDYAVFPFIKTPGVFTIAATGQEACEWAVDWLKKHPETQNETVMAAYCYRVKK